MDFQKAHWPFESAAKAKQVLEQPTGDLREEHNSSERTTVSADDYDDPDEYQAMSSEAENDDGVGSDENSEFDEESEDRGADELDEEDTEDPLFTESLIDAVGDFANIASGTIAADILKGMSTSGWSKPVTYSPFSYLNQPYVPRSIESLREN
ncbi:hypothetical protein PInf_022167 [Phytophthora infestans]|nr:hypothetical protein PInf_022167 [Phytophthora infestans]